MPLSIAVSGLAAVSICGLSPLLSGILPAHMMDALEVAGKIFHLPALVRADLLPLYAAAGARTLTRAQVIDSSGDGEVFEVGKMTPTSAPLYPAQFLFRFRIALKIIGFDWLAVQP